MNVIFISMDTLRADHLGCLGNERNLTPNLDRIASEGALFTNAFASDIPTQPSHTAIFTGRSGVSTGIVSHFHPPARLDADISWLPTIFRDASVRDGGGRPSVCDEGLVHEGLHRLHAAPWSVTVARVGHRRHRDSVAGRALQGGVLPLSALLGRTHSLCPAAALQTLLYEGSVLQRDPLITEKLLSRPTYPLFAENLYNHLDVIPNVDYVSDLYDAEVAYLDYEIGRLFDYLGDSGSWTRPWSCSLATMART